MKASYIDYSETGSFSPAIIRYLENDPALAEFHSFRPDIEGFRQLISCKKNNYNRQLLQDVFGDQYSGTDLRISQPVSENIRLLADKNTFTVTTGHQLNLFTGPLYFIFKIVSTIKLAKELKAHFPDNNFIPVYWMASEDHDFAEINHTYIAGKKIAWERTASGATGKLNTQGIAQTLREYISTLGISANAHALAEIVSAAYAKETLAEATRLLVNSLFGEYGLLILDADDTRLKKEFSDIISRDIIEQNSYKHILDSNTKLESAGITAQVNPREINFFYLLDELRERIVFEDDRFKVLNTELRFTEAELKTEIKNFPERFSPNVVMRPLYQEYILPNLAYIGGAAEIVYWLQLKKNFDSYTIDFPILLLRNSALIAPASVSAKLSRLDLSFRDMFSDLDELKKAWTLSHSDQDLQLGNEWQELNTVFEALRLRVCKIDPTLGPSSEAVKARLKKAVDNLEKKMIKAGKRNFTDALSQIEAIRAQLFSGGGLQERKENFGPFYVKYGKEFISLLIRDFNPLDLKFTILEE